LTDPTFFTLLLVGLLGGTHCFGMCGGIVAALSLQAPAGRGTLSILLAYNAGRISSYVAAGMLAGFLGSLIGDLLILQRLLRLLAGVMLIAFGLTLIGVAVLEPVERAGQKLWNLIRPWGARFLPVQGPAQAFPLGMLWGWLPCGLVYSALVSALATGSAWQGGVALLAFGLGTLPNLLLAGFALARFRNHMQGRGVRIVAGLMVIGFGVHAIWQVLAR
jgi:sulfite exporter TauE/SafE